MAHGVVAWCVSLCSPLGRAAVGRMLRFIVCSATVFIETNRRCALRSDCLLKQTGGVLCEGSEDLGSGLEVSTPQVYGVPGGFFKQYRTLHTVVFQD